MSRLFSDLVLPRAFAISLRLVLSLALILPLGLTACGSTKSSTGMETTRGVVVPLQMDHTWLAVQQTCTKLGGGTQLLEASARRATMSVGTVRVTITLSMHTSGDTIVDVRTSQNDASGVATANRVVSEIQSAIH